MHDVYVNEEQIIQLSKIVCILRMVLNTNNVINQSTNKGSYKHLFLLVVVVLTVQEN